MAAVAVTLLILLLKNHIFIWEEYTTVTMATDSLLIWHVYPYSAQVHEPGVIQ